jgi:hypothetical protein
VPIAVQRTHPCIMHPVTHTLVQACMVVCMFIAFACGVPAVWP